MKDVRMFILRVASAAALFYGTAEFFKDPENLADILSGGDELMSEMYDWGHNKFMGIQDNSTQIEVKKSARQIYAEAFMDDESDVMRTNTQFVQYADDDAVKTVLNGKKIVCFYENIIGDDTCTIDGHARNIAYNERVNLTDSKTTIGVVEYRKLQEAYQIAAKRCRVNGKVLKAYELQAITWVTWRKQHGIA